MLLFTLYLDYLFGKIRVTLFTPDLLLCSDSSFSKLMVVGFNGAEINCGIAHILGILLKNSYEFQILLEATFIYSLFSSSDNNDK